MPTPLQPELDALRELLVDPDRLVRAVAAGRRRGATPVWRRVELRPVDLKAGRRLQIVGYDERQAHTANHAYGAEAEAAVAELLAEPFGNWHVDTAPGTNPADPSDPSVAGGETVALRVTKKGEAQVHRAPRPAPTEGVRPSDRATIGRLHADETTVEAGVRPHDRQKVRLLDPAHPFLREVGIADAHGRVKPSRQAKYRQVEDLLRQLDVVLPVVEADGGGERAVHSNQGRLHMVDLGCGNAYLTFGAYAYLADVRGRDVELVGIDVREQARGRNTELAERLGWSDHVTFVAGAIADTGAESGADGGRATGTPDNSVGSRPDVVLALHACDTATDDALVRAARWQAPIVLAAPCCHHDLQRRLAAATTPQAYAPVVRHGLLRERFADVLTDAWRALILRLLGYRVDVVEFVDSAHTPRNALLRAVRTGAAPTPELVAEFHALEREWGVRPYLAEALAAELEPVVGAR